MYIGRFAPSPTGPLHFGSLIAAVASYAEARKQHGQWLVRMEDLDKPREIAGAANNILTTLAAFGFEWDGDIVYQSQRAAYYQTAFDELLHENLIYPCSCSRKEIADSASIGIEGAVYPRTCLNHAVKSNIPVAWRIKTNNELWEFTDAIQINNTKLLSQILAKDIGDFILKRTDGFFAYQLAVVVDDAVQGITHIVRGADLLSSTPRQMYLQYLLNFKQPHYTHVPIAVNAAGEKLSKQTLAEAIDALEATKFLVKALIFLGQEPSPGLQNNSINEVWKWTLENWDLQKIPRVFKLSAG